MASGLFAEFLGIARKNCCNYSEKGPGGKTDYCWTTGTSCLVKMDKFCDWFDRAVVACRPFRGRGLLAGWKLLWEKGPEQTNTKLCGCGEEFLKTSPRQKYCGKCSELSKREKTRLRVRKMRKQNKKP
jgi:hypothetical protein